MNNLQTIYTQFQERGYSLELYTEKDHDALYEIFREVVETGTQFPYESSSQEEFQLRFFEPKTRIYVCRTAQDEVVGGFYLKANYPGRSSHIANAAYMIHSSHRGKGLGRLMCQASLELAQELGFLAMQYNMVLSQNTLAVNLYIKLGFTIRGTIPNAVRNPDNSFQDGYVMHKSLLGSYLGSEN